MKAVANLAASSAAFAPSKSTLVCNTLALSAAFVAGDDDDDDDVDEDEEDDEDEEEEEEKER